MAKRWGRLAWVLLAGACASSEPLEEGASGSGAGAGGSDASSGGGGRSGAGGDDGGHDGSAGTSGDGGTAGRAGMSGASGIGGAGGQSGGAGGVAEDCGTSNSGGRCALLAHGWFAIKVTLDVWWTGTSVSDPGRDDVELVMLARIDDSCGADGEPMTELKVCGVELPITTSDVQCDAHEHSFDEEIWESPRMPRFSTKANAAMLSPGEMLSLVPRTGLFGFDLLEANGELPAPVERESVSCADGSGLACFPDHDDDALPGLTLIARHDGATYQGPYGDGLCTSGTPYRIYGLPVYADVSGVSGAVPRAAKVQIGMRAHAGIAPTIADDCASAAGNATSDRFDLMTAGCLVEPTSLPEGQERIASGDFTCTEAERIFVAETLPQYRVLQADDVPGEIVRPLGWVSIERDILRTPSVGPRSELIHLADLSDAEPSCWTVRTTFDPDSDR